MGANRALQRIEQAAAEQIKLCHCDLIRAETQAAREYLMRHGVWPAEGEAVEFIYRCFMCDEPIAYDVQLFPAEIRAKLARYFELFRQHWRSIGEFPDELQAEADQLEIDIWASQEQVSNAAFGAEVYAGANEAGAAAAEKIRPYVEAGILEWVKRL